MEVLTVRHFASPFLARVLRRGYKSCKVLFCEYATKPDPRRNRPPTTWKTFQGRFRRPELCWRYWPLELIPVLKAATYSHCNLHRSIGQVLLPIGSHMGVQLHFSELYIH